MLRGNKTPAASVRGGRKDSASSKIMKRDFGLVSPASPENQVTLSNIRILFKEELEPVTADLETLKESVEFTSSKLEELANLHTQVEKLEKKCEALTLKLNASEAKCEQLAEKVVTLETFSRQNNLKFLGIKSLVPNISAREDCEEIIVDLCNRVGISIGHRELEKAHRLGQFGSLHRPIIAKLSNFKDKQSILSKKQQFKDIGVTVVEDFPAEIQARRKIFGPVIQAAYRSGKHKARLIGDKLLLDGKQYSTRDTSKLPEDLRPEYLSTVTNGDKIAFFSLNSKLSNHYNCTFTVNGQTFSSAEQYFMCSKAKEFGDHNAVRAIMSSTDASAAKAIGSRIKNFDREVWRKVRDTHMRTGLTAKFHQNDDLKTFLKGTDKKILIEANEKDTYWAAGLHLNDQDIWNPSRWKGKNRLGTMLTEIREHLH